MLKAPLDAVEDRLLATSRIPANAGHALHRGTPRESFIREFLEGHISTRVSIGTGEIIDAASTPRQPRNQFDIVIYRNDYPRLDLGGGINAFLAESSTIRKTSGCSNMSIRMIQLLPDQIILSRLAGPFLPPMQGMSRMSLLRSTRCRRATQ